MPEEYFQKELTEDDIRKINELKYNRPITGLGYVFKIRCVEFITVAKELGITKQNISMWASGERLIPDKYINKLIDITGINEELLKKKLDNIDKVFLLKKEIERLEDHNK